MEHVLDSNDPPAMASNIDFHGPDEAIAKLIAELAAARLEFGPIFRDRTGTYGTREFEYAPLGSLTEATAKPLAKHGIVVMQFITTSATEGKHRLTTMVAGHGARIMSMLDFAPQQAKEDGAYKGEWIKEYGKLCTYLCRYQYKNTFVLDSEPDADDDAPQPERQPAPRREAPRPDTRQQAAPPAAAKPAPAPATSRAAQMEQTLSTPVQPLRAVAPVTPPPTAAPTPPVAEEEPCDEDMLHQMVELRTQLGLGRTQLAEMCQSQWNIDPAKIRSSMRIARTVITNLQALLADRSRGAA